MERKGFAEMRLCPGRVLAEVLSPMLDRDQQNRVARAWLVVYLSGNWSESEWRRSLAYTESEWRDHRETFSEVLEGPEDWALPFMRDEMLRQGEVSEAQSRRRRGEPAVTGGDQWSPEAPVVTNAVAVGVAVEEKKKKEPKPKAAADAAFVLPDWVPPEPFKGLIEARVKLRKPATDRAKTLIVRDLDDLRKQGHDPTAMLDLATKRGWLTVFPPRPETNGHAPAAPVSDGWEVTPTTKRECATCRKPFEVHGHWKHDDCPTCKANRPPLKALSWEERNGTRS